MTDIQKNGITFANEKGEIVIRIMLNRIPQMEAPQKRKETNYDDNSYDFCSGCCNGCQGSKCKQQDGNGQVKCRSK